ncbi:hypothetical protein GGI59_006597 [Rhizobium lentis]|uniref:Uncharacterized protein n=1 Tax=Rhizobium lentis TaxID=1138194 RepID=A0A7W8XL12_9HYPH|nr:hypothetical protein [Rhizobium lentis]MBB5554243.1 hypothetical protein [Rhizobium lentis]MBB5564879.1 hypothetical protein [Rhizobium lentis]MBB5571387.1 hypothetical protein [Rhizobium lentis]
MRAVLLARATITSMGGLRSSICESQGSRDPFRIAQRTAALAPMISNRRKVRSPMREVSPSFCFPPEDRCSGVRPSHAAKLCPFLNVVADGASAASAVAVIGPIPGIVIKRLASASSLARRAISRSNTATLSSSDCNCTTSSDKIGRAASGMAASLSSIAATSLAAWKSLAQPQGRFQQDGHVSH